jgi:cytochrome bd-type quinol oxidase subunit 1
MSRKMKIDSHDDERADMIFKFVVRLTVIAFLSGIVIGIVLKSILPYVWRHI